MLTKKVNSFTLAEMLVVLVLSAIIVSIALVALVLVQKQVRSIESIQRKKTAIVLLERGLRQDFNQGRAQCDLKNKTLTVFKYTDTVLYKFNEDFVLRNNDTLLIEIETVKFYLDGQEVFKKEIDAIELVLSERFQNKNLFISRLKDATFYMNF